MSPRRYPRPALVLVALAIALPVAMVAGVAFGAVSVPPREVVAAIGRALRGVERRAG